MKFGEVIKNSFETVGDFTNEQLEKRNARLENPDLQAKLEQTKINLKEDLKKACCNGLEALYRVIIVAQTSSVWEGAKKLGSVYSHNSQFDDEFALLKKLHPNIKDDPKTMQELRDKKKYLSEKDKISRQKRSYTEVPAEMISEFVRQWGKGGMSTIKLVGNLGSALGRTTKLAGRYAIGK